MLSILDILNHFLGYFNLNTTFKNRLFTVIGTVGNFYLLYLAVNAFQNQVYVRGILFSAAFIGLFYFCVLNIYYYFFGKNAKFDFSPKLEKKLGKVMRDPNHQETAAIPLNQTVIPAAGLFAQENLLPGTLTISPEEQANTDELAEALIREGYLSLNYGGLTDQQLWQNAQTQSGRFYAIGSGVSLPFYELRQEHNHLNGYAGINVMNAKKIGRLTQVGLTKISEANAHYTLVLAQAIISGGPYKITGRHGLIEGKEPYQIQVQIAYQDKNEK